MISKTLLEISQSFRNLSENYSVSIQQAADLMVETLKNKKKIFFCGNGGSAADSQHLAAELIGRYRKNRKPIPAIALTTDTSIITAVANDFSYEEIFSRQLEALSESDDVLYAISTSGKSKNVIAALKLAKQKNIKTIALTGEGGGDMKDNCDILIAVPSTRPDRIQEMHIAIGQIICEIIEDTIC